MGEFGIDAKSLSDGSVVMNGIAILVNSMMCWRYSRLEGTRQTRIMSSWEITLIVDTIRLKP